MSAAQALYFIGATIQLTVIGLVGHLLAADKSLATLPVTAFVIGTVTITIPASLLMQRVGRRDGFQLGAMTAFFAALLATYAIFERSFPLFCLATALTGVY